MSLRVSSVSVCSFFFFFSSRRRHTRYWRDWSSDVCSSDLGQFVALFGSADRYLGEIDAALGRSTAVPLLEAALEMDTRMEIGRASCRERVEISGGAGSFKKKDNIETAQ